MRTDTGLGKTITLQIPAGVDFFRFTGRKADVVASFKNLLLIKNKDQSSIAFREWVPKSWCKFKEEPILNNKLS